MSMVRVLGFAMLSVLAVTACGDDDDDDGPTGALDLDPAFAEGVAAGAVTDSAATLWRRLGGGGQVIGQLAGDNAFAEVVEEAELTPEGEADFTVHWDVRDLEESTTYVYRFVRGDGASPVGRFTTAPDPNDEPSFTFAMSGDADGTRDESGQPTVNNFELFDTVRADAPDLFLFAGDTVYADSFNAPEAADTLDEFRFKHRENRGYQPLRDFLRSTAVFPSIDDHEVIDEVSGQGVEPELFAAGYRAFHDYYPFGGVPDEWNDIEGPDDAPELYESSRWGSAAEFFILDTRTHRSPTEYCELPSGDRDQLRTAGRQIVRGGDERLLTLRELLGYPQEADTACLRQLGDPNRTMLGDEQQQWLINGLRDSEATFKFVMVSGRSRSCLSCLTTVGRDTRWNARRSCSRSQLTTWRTSSFVDGHPRQLHQRSQRRRFGERGSGGG